MASSQLAGEHRDSVTRLFRIFGWISLVGFGIAFALQLTERFRGTPTAYASRLLGPIAMTPVSVWLIQGPQAPGSRIVAGVAIVLNCVEMALTLASIW